MTRLRKMMLEELQRRNYTENTIRHYLRAVEDFARRFRCSPDRLGPRHIREYQAELFQKRKLSANSVRQHLAALRFFYVKTLRQSLEHCRHSLSEEDTPPADDSEPGRSHATHSCSAHPLRTYSAHDPLRHRREGTLREQ